MNTDHLIKQMQHVRYFQDLSLKDLQNIIESGQIRRYREDNTIFLEKDDSAGIFVLLSGRVHLCKLSQNGQESIISVIEPVIMFNEVSTLDFGANPVTALAAEDSVVWNACPGSFQQILLQYPDLALGMLRILAARNRILVEHFEDLSFRTVLARSAKLLLQISQGGEIPINRARHSNLEMAARVSTIPEAFSRALGTFKSEGIITATRKQVLIKKADKLRQLAKTGVVLSDNYRG